jgi:hypothetical protein
MLHEIPELDRSGLRNFALTMAAVVSVLFGLALPWLFGLGYHLWPWIVGGILALWGLVAPSTLTPLYRGWMKFGMAIGWFNSRVILGLMFYLVILPAGLIMRLAGKDPMARSLHGADKTYRIASKQLPADQMEKPY